MLYCVGGVGGVGVWIGCMSGLWAFDPLIKIRFVIRFYRKINKDSDSWFGFWCIMDLDSDLWFVIRSTRTCDSGSWFGFVQNKNLDSDSWFGDTKKNQFRSVIRIRDSVFSPWNVWFGFVIRRILTNHESYDSRITWFVELCLECMLKIFFCDGRKIYNNHDVTSRSAAGSGRLPRNPKREA